MGVAWDTQTHRCGRQTDGDIQGQWEMDAERDSHRLGRSGLVTVPKMVIDQVPGEGARPGNGKAAVLAAAVGPVGSQL